MGGKFSLDLNLALFICDEPSLWIADADILQPRIESDRDFVIEK
jgi:hypothetical protein